MQFKKIKTQAERLRCAFVVGWDIDYIEENIAHLKHPSYLGKLEILPNGDVITHRPTATAREGRR